MRLRNNYAERKILEGGVANPSSLSDSLVKQLVNTGNCEEYHRGFLNLLRRQRHWQEARINYKKISLPVLLIYGDQDWAPKHEREKTQNLIPNVNTIEVKDRGHFLTLDKPEELAQVIIAFVKKQ